MVVIVTVALVAVFMVVTVTVALVAVFMFMMMVMMVVLLLDLAEKVSRQRMAFRHGFQQLRAGQFIPRRGHDASRFVMAAQQGNTFVELFRLHVLGTAQNHRTGMFDLIVKELAEVLHIHLCFRSVGDRDECIQFYRLVLGNALHRMDHVGQLADPGRLDQDAVGMIGRDDFLKRLAKVSDQRAADAAGIHFGDLDPGFLQKAAVNTDLTEFVFDQYDLFAGKRFLKQLFDQRGFARPKEAGNDIDLCHLKTLLSVRLCLYL